jgi:hypothetical protein
MIANRSGIPVKRARSSRFATDLDVKPSIVVEWEAL